MPGSLVVPVPRERGVRQRRLRPPAGADAAALSRWRAEAVRRLAALLDVPESAPDVGELTWAAGHQFLADEAIELLVRRLGVTPGS